MIRFQCDGCGDLKANGEDWILGFAAERVGVTSARREVTIASSWDRPRAVDPLAVHFCSDECRIDYMDALFGEPATTQRIEKTVTSKRIQRTVPGAVVETVVHEVPKKKTVVRKRRKAA
jgi:hypothetical protein